MIGLRMRQGGWPAFRGRVGGGQLWEDRLLARMRDGVRVLVRIRRHRPKRRSGVKRHGAMSGGRGRAESGGSKWPVRRRRNAPSSLYDRSRHRSDGRRLFAAAAGAAGHRRAGALALAHAGRSRGFHHRLVSRDHVNEWVPELGHASRRLRHVVRPTEGRGALEEGEARHVSIEAAEIRQVMPQGRTVLQGRPLYTGSRSSSFLGSQRSHRLRRPAGTGGGREPEPDRSREAYSAR